MIYNILSKNITKNAIYKCVVHDMSPYPYPTFKYISQYLKFMKVRRWALTYTRYSYLGTCNIAGGQNLCLHYNY